MTKYVGIRHPSSGSAFVSVIDDTTGTVSALERGYRYVNHSPTGFEWGYTGSGPAQLAFAILLDHYGAPGQAWLFYQDFKERVIAMLNRDRWELTTAEVEKALDGIREFRSRAQKEGSWKSST